MARFDPLGAWHGLNPPWVGCFPSLWDATTVANCGVRGVGADRPGACTGHRTGGFGGLCSRCGYPFPMAPDRLRSDSLRYRLWKLYRLRHPTWVGMCVNFWDLTLWSWLMASAHGAGLMVVPVLLGAKSLFCGTAPAANLNALLRFNR